MKTLNYPEDAKQIAGTVAKMKVGDAIAINGSTFTLEQFDVLNRGDNRVFLSADAPDLEYPYIHCRNEEGKAVWYTVDGMASAIRAKSVRFS